MIDTIEEQKSGTVKTQAAKLLSVFSDRIDGMNTFSVIYSLQILSFALGTDYDNSDDPTIVE